MRTGRGPQLVTHLLGITPHGSGEREERRGGSEGRAAPPASTTQHPPASVRPRGPSSPKRAPEPRAAPAPVRPAPPASGPSLTPTFRQLPVCPPHLDPLPDARRHVPGPRAPRPRPSRSPSEAALRTARGSWRPSGCPSYAAAADDAAAATERYPRYLRRPGRRLAAPILKNSRRCLSEPVWR